MCQMPGQESTTGFSNAAVLPLQQQWWWGGKGEHLFREGSWGRGGEAWTVSRGNSLGDFNPKGRQRNEAVVDEDRSKDSFFLWEQNYI